MGASPIGRALVNFKHEGIIMTFNGSFAEVFGRCKKVLDDNPSLPIYYWNERNRYSKDGTSPILIDYAKALEVIKDYMSSFDVVTVKVNRNQGKDRIMISADNYD